MFNTSTYTREKATWFCLMHYTCILNYVQLTMYNYTILTRLQLNYSTIQSCTKNTDHVAWKPDDLRHNKGRRAAQLLCALNGTVRLVNIAVAVVNCSL